MIAVFAILIAFSIFILSILTLEIEIRIIIKECCNYSFVILRLCGGIICLRFNLSLKPEGRSSFFAILRKIRPNFKERLSSQEILQLMKRSLRFSRRNFDNFKFLLSKARVKNFSVILSFGVDDAFKTAMISGEVSALFSLLVLYLKKRHGLKRYKVAVIPQFEGLGFGLNMGCIIAFKIGYIIITGIKIAFQSLKDGDNER